jgi:hypothetical protein
MSDQIPVPEITEAMKYLLQEVPKNAFPSKEETFFSIEGVIGHLENPTTELLRFFMAPDGGHDLGPLFLRAFFTCRGENPNDISFDDVTAVPQVQTEDRKFIDLLVRGSNWVLLIENKIGAQINNPLDSYEEQAKRNFPGRTPLFAILSPDGKKDPDFPQWKAVSYQNYCNALKSEFTKTVFDHPISKWQVFAREFIVHLENTLCDPAMKMTPAQTQFVETNLPEIRDLRKLYSCYITDLMNELSERLQKELPIGRKFQFFEDDNRLNRLYCDEHIGELWLHLFFQTPAHGPPDSRRDFVIAAWVKDLTEEQRRRAEKLLFAKGGDPEGGGQWVGEFHCHDRPTAVNELCKLAKELFDLWGNEPPSSPT